MGNKESVIAPPSVIVADQSVPAHTSQLAPAAPPSFSATITTAVVTSETPAVDVFDGDTSSLDMAADVDSHVLEKSVLFDGTKTCVIVTTPIYKVMTNPIFVARPKINNPMEVPMFELFPSNIDQYVHYVKWLYTTNQHKFLRIVPNPDAVVSVVKDKNASLQAPNISMNRDGTLSDNNKNCTIELDNDHVGCIGCHYTTVNFINEYKDDSSKGIRNDFSVIHNMKKAIEMPVCKCDSLLTTYSAISNENNIHIFVQGDVFSSTRPRVVV